MDVRIATRSIVALACLVLGVPGWAAARPSSLVSSDRGGHYWFDYLREPARRDAAAARPALARDAHVRQGGGVQRRLARVPGSAAGDLRRAARVGSCRRPAAPRQWPPGSRVAIQRRPPEQPVVDHGRPVQLAVAALGLARASGGFRRARRRTLRHAAQRRAQSLPAARRRPESHRTAAPVSCRWR